jgi:hypothetical protein
MQLLKLSQKLSSTVIFILLAQQATPALAGPSEAASRPTAPVPAPVIWIKCADEGGTCRYPASAQTLRYGNGHRWNQQSVRTGAAGSIGCTNGVFADPIPGTRKACMYTMTKL